MKTWRDILDTLSTVAIQQPNRLDDPAVGWFDAESKPIDIIVVETPEVGDGEERLIVLPADEVDED